MCYLQTYRSSFVCLPTIKVDDRTISDRHDNNLAALTESRIMFLLPAESFSRIQVIFLPLSFINVIEPSLDGDGALINGEYKLNLTIAGEHYVESDGTQVSCSQVMLVFAERHALLSFAQCLKTSSKVKAAVNDGTKQFRVGEELSHLRRSAATPINMTVSSEMADSTNYDTESRLESSFQAPCRQSSMPSGVSDVGELHMATVSKSTNNVENPNISNAGSSILLRQVDDSGCVESEQSAQVSHLQGDVEPAGDRRVSMERRQGSLDRDTWRQVSTKSSPSSPATAPCTILNKTLQYLAQESLSAFSQNFKISSTEDALAATGSIQEVTKQGGPLEPGLNPVRSRMSHGKVMPKALSMIKTRTSKPSAREPGKPMQKTLDSKTSISDKEKYPIGKGERQNERTKVDWEEAFREKKKEIYSSPRLQKKNPPTSLSRRTSKQSQKSQNKPQRKRRPQKKPSSSERSQSHSVMTASATTQLTQAPNGKSQGAKLVTPRRQEQSRHTSSPGHHDMSDIPKSSIVSEKNSSTSLSSAASKVSQERLKKHVRTPLKLCQPGTGRQDDDHQKFIRVDSTQTNLLPQVRDSRNTKEELQLRRTRPDRDATEYSEHNGDDLAAVADEILNGLSQSAGKSTNHDYRDGRGLLVQDEPQMMGENPYQTFRNLGQGQNESGLRSFGSKLTQTIMARHSLINGDPMSRTEKFRVRHLRQQSMSSNNQDESSQLRDPDRPTSASYSIYANEESQAAVLDTSDAVYSTHQADAAGNIPQFSASASELSHPSLSVSADLEKTPRVDDTVAFNLDDMQASTDTPATTMDRQETDTTGVSMRVGDQTEENQGIITGLNHNEGNPARNAPAHHALDANCRKADIQKANPAGESGKVSEASSDLIVDSRDRLNPPGTKDNKTNPFLRRLSSINQDNNSMSNGVELRPLATQDKGSVSKNIGDMKPKAYPKWQITPIEAPNHPGSSPTQSPNSMAKKSPKSTLPAATATTPSVIGISHVSKTTPPPLFRRSRYNKLAWTIQEHTLPPATLTKAASKDLSRLPQKDGSNFETPVQHTDQLAVENADIRKDNRFLTDESIQKKTQLIKFGPAGPQNQGVYSSPTKIGNTPLPSQGLEISNKKVESTSKRKAGEEPLESGKKSIFISKKPRFAMKSRMSPEPSEPPDSFTTELREGTNLGASEYVTSSVEPDGGIAYVDSEEVGVTLGKDASQGSKTDQNGSPRHFPHTSDHVQACTIEPGGSLTSIHRSPSRTERNNDAVLPAEVFDPATPLEKTISTPSPPSPHQRKTLVQRDLGELKQPFPSKVGPEGSASHSSELSQSVTNVKSQTTVPSVPFVDIPSIKSPQAYRTLFPGTSKFNHNITDQPPLLAVRRAKSPETSSMPVPPIVTKMVPATKDHRTSGVQLTIPQAPLESSKPPLKIWSPLSTRVPGSTGAIHLFETSVNDVAHLNQKTNDMVSSAKARPAEETLAQPEKAEVRRAKTSQSDQARRQLPLSPPKQANDRKAVPSLEKIIMQNAKRAQISEKAVADNSSEGSPRLGITDGDNETTLVDNIAEINDEVTVRNATRVLQDPRSESSTPSSDIEQENVRGVHEARARWREGLEGVAKSTSEMLHDLSDLLLFRLASAGEGVTLKVGELERGGHWLLDSFANKAAQYAVAEGTHLEPLRQERLRAYDGAMLAMEDVKRTVKNLRSIRELEDAVQEEKNTVLGKLASLLNERSEDIQALQA